MTSAPLVQAVAQVNFPIVSRLQSVEGIAPLQDALFGLFPYMTQQIIQEMSLMIGPAGPAAPESAQTTVHQFSDDDGWTLSVTVSSATLSVGGSQYAGVRDFARRFRQVCEALYEAGRVRRCDRLGVRYLNLVELVDGSDEWASWFRPDIIGLAHPSLSGMSLTASLTETRLQQEPVGVLAGLTGHVTGVIRHGVVPPGSVMQGVPPRPIDHRAFLFDMDAFVQTVQPFDPGLSEQFIALHDEIENVFHWAVTDAGRDRFGYELATAPQVAG
jgi:uncharacterized protein (TIGR04255 family)